MATAVTLIDGLIVIGGGITAARKYILPSLLAEMRGSLHTFSGETLPRVQMKVYDLDDATQFAAFAQAIPAGSRFTAAIVKSSTIRRSASG